MHRIGIALTAGLLCIALPNTSRAGFPTERFTSYADIQIKSPAVQCTLWIDAAGIETLQQLDRDGDFEYSSDEMNAARYFITLYLQRNFLVMWDQAIRPHKIGAMDVARRAGSDRTYFRVEFRVTDLPPGQSVSIASRILSELTPEARTYAKIRFENREELYGLGPTRYFSTDRAERPLPPDSTFRPESQHGRIASVGDWSVEMLYALPERAFYLYTLTNDPHTPMGVGDGSIEVSIQPGKEGPYRPVRLAAKPLPGDKPGMTSRFTLVDPQFAAFTTFNADIRIGRGAAMKRVIFEFPAVTIPERSPGGAKTTRRGCANLCPGVDLNSPPSDKCPRCNGRLLPLNGDTAPGLHMVGAHGGMLLGYGGAGERFEGLITTDSEFRLYITNEMLETLPLKKLTGSMLFAADERFQDSAVEIQARKGPDGRYLFATLPPTASLPLHVRWLFDFNDGEGASQVDFLIEEAVQVPTPASQPSTSQPVAASQPASKPAN